MKNFKQAYYDLKKQQLLFASALDRIAELIYLNEKPSDLLTDLNNILGETLQLDRTLIYYISSEENLVIGLCEWLNKNEPDIQPTIDTYPLDLFRVSYQQLLKSQKYIESYSDAVASSFVEEGSGKILHGGMNIKSLLWFPFDFDKGGFYLVALNQLTHLKKWSTEEIQFIASAVKQVSLALMKIKLNLERSRLIESEKVLQELNATKDKIFSIISHDLRNPFNSLMGYNELLISNAESYSPEKVRRFAQEMHKSSEQALSLLENLLHWSRLQTGKLVPSPEKLNPQALLDELISLTRAEATKKKITIKPDIQTSDMVYADREMTKTVLRNLVTNALKYSYPKDVITVKAENLEDQLQFTVSDTGIGIEKEYVSDIFKVDCKVSKPGTNNETGTGLGLILCKEFVEINNGRIWAESELGKGSDFKLTLPLWQEEC
jgi:signal transduction histidine kinase